MGATAVAGLALGLGSVVLIFATLREMGNTNRIMREEQRPWLIIDSAPFGILGRMYRSSPRAKLSLMVTNKGKLPAKDAIATFVNFSHDTMTAFEVSTIVEPIILRSLDKAKSPQFTEQFDCVQANGAASRCQSDTAIKLKVLGYRSYPAAFLTRLKQL